MVGAEEPLQIPPTRAPRRRRKWPRGAKTTALAVAVLLGALAASSLVNNEVDRRLAAVPLPSTSTPRSTTTSLVPSSSTSRVPQTDPVPVTVSEAPSTSTSVPVPEVPQSAHDIIAKLDKLPVRDERSFGYSRYRFGLWQDSDGDGCTVREDILVNQAIQAVRRTNPCDIVSGRWQSPYDNAMVENPDDMRIDHLVGLFEAWRSGGYDWSDAKRNAYLNDVADKGAVLAVSSISSQDKAGRDPGDWLPTNESFRCTYLQTWVDIKTKWKLSVDAGEREAIAAAALAC